MIGVYNYTVILTYLSMISGAVGTILTMTGIGHPYLGAIFLLVCGTLDGLDGRVARTKPDRTKFEKDFGMQIDSLSDLVCFGILPVAIGISHFRITGHFTELFSITHPKGDALLSLCMIAIAAFYILTALIRLAYYNSTAEERHKLAEETGIQYFTGVPVTVAALIFPIPLIIHYFLKIDLSVIYFFVMFVLALLFVGNFKVAKPHKSSLVIVVLVGFAEFCINVYIMTQL